MPLVYCTAFEIAANSVLWLLLVWFTNVHDVRAELRWNTLVVLFNWAKKKKKKKSCYLPPTEP